MGKTVSIYIDDDILEKVKKKNIPVSEAVRIALKDWLSKEALEEDYDCVEKAIFGSLTDKGQRAWDELLKETDRW